MNTSTSRSAPVLVALIMAATPLFFAGCSENDFAHEGIHRCDTYEMPIAFDQPGPQGENTLEYLALAEMDVDLTLNHVDHDGEEPLSVTIIRIGEDAYFVDTDGCGSRFEIPLRITLKTTDSDLLDEVFEVRSYVVGNDLRVDHSFEPGELQGDFSPTVDEGEIYRFSLRMEFKADGSGDGGIDASIERQQGDTVSSSVEPRLVWEW